MPGPCSQEVLDSYYDPFPSAALLQVPASRPISGGSVGTLPLKARGAYAKHHFFIVESDDNSNCG